MAFVAFLVFEDGAGAEEADAGDDALHDPAHGIGLGAGHLWHQYEQRRAKRHQHVGAHSGRLALALALEAENATQGRGDQQAHGDACQLRGVCDVSEFGLQGHPDFVPPGVHGVVLEKVMEGGQRRPLIGCTERWPPGVP